MPTSAIIPDVLRDSHYETYTDMIRACTLAGNTFSASLGLLNAASGTNNYGVSVFNNANTFNVIVYSIQVANGSGGITALLQDTTTNPAFTTYTPIPQLKGSGLSRLPAGAVTIATTNQSISMPYTQIATPSSGSFEMLTNNATIILPAGQAQGLVVYIQSYAAGYNSAIVRWIEI